MIKGRVSVVVPIYNVEQYLNRCLTSIVNQSYPDLEIILVDDGSPDGCPLLCDQWAQKDSRIQVIHKENAGLGMARNTGIAHATGEYICFIDSDDYVDEKTVEKTLSLAKQEQADIVVFGCTRVDAKGKEKSKSVPAAPKICYSGEEVRNVFLPDLIDGSVKEAQVKDLCLSAWSCLFSLELIKRINWEFVSERKIISEDSFSLMSLYADVSCVAILNDALYYYCENSGSLTQVYREDRYDKLKHYYSASLTLAEEKGYCKEVSNRISSLFFSYTIGALKQIVAADLPFRKRKEILKKIICDEAMRKAVESVTHHYSSWTKKILYWTVRKKLYHLALLLVKLQNIRDR